jgi:hypothetical protein
MKKKKNKVNKIAIHAELRKESQTFDGYLKYEITIKNQDGSIEKVPAYGKDLQDALSRVVHDAKVTELDTNFVRKVPAAGWALSWILGLALIVISVYDSVPNAKYQGLWFLVSTISYAFATLSISNWFTLRNRAK